MSDQKTVSKKNNLWIWGGLAMVVIAVVAAICFSPGKDIREFSLQQLNASFEKYRDALKLTELQVEAFDPLIEAATQEHTSTAVLALTYVLFDESTNIYSSHNVDTYAVAHELGDVLRAKPDAETNDVLSIVEKHPWVKDSLDTARKKKGLRFPTK